MGKSSINWPFSMAMLDNQRLAILGGTALYPSLISYLAGVSENSEYRNIGVLQNMFFRTELAVSQPAILVSQRKKLVGYHYHYIHIITIIVPW